MAQSLLLKLQEVALFSGYDIFNNVHDGGYHATFH